MSANRTVTHDVDNFIDFTTIKHPIITMLERELLHLAKKKERNTGVQRTKLFDVQPY